MSLEGSIKNHLEDLDEEAPLDVLVDLDVLEVLEVLGDSLVPVLVVHLPEVLSYQL